MPLVLGFRYPLAGLRSLRGRRVNLLEESVVHMRVRVSDCDINMHVNNGRYLSLMDIGRIEHVARAGAIPVFRRNRWNPVAGGATIRFRRELRVGSRYTLRTQVVGWDDGWLFFEQNFDRADGMLAARSYVKVAILDAERKRVDPATVIRALGVDADAPTLPEGVVNWQRSDAG